MMNKGIKGFRLPIYEYRCEKCGHKFEKLLLSLGNPNEVSCPRCQSGVVRRVLSPIGSLGSRSTTESRPPKRRG